VGEQGLITAAPTFVAIETNSAWVVILVVSLVTFPLALLLRRVIDRPGALASSLLLGLPLGLPLVAALAFHKSVLPEVSVLRPLAPDLFRQVDHNLLHLLFVPDGRGQGLVPYVFSGSPGRWLLVLGAGFSSFMLLRRLAGTIAMRRLIARSHAPDPGAHGDLLHRFERLAERVGLGVTPALLFLPEDVAGAFVTGAGKKTRVLLSPSLVAELTGDELDAILAHELAHVAARDVPVMVIAGLLRDLVAWNPLSHLALRRLVAEREFEADRCAASLTGKPLVVATSLLKMCEHVRRRRLVASPSVAFLRRRGPLRRRVQHLLALADGTMAPRSVGRVPYVAAACLAAVLGLQVGAQVAAQSDFAIVWDVPDTGGIPVWSRDFSGREAQLPDATVGRPRATKGRPVNAKTFPAAQYPVFGDGYALREKDFHRWLTALNAWARKKGLAPRTLNAEVMQSWRAVPVFSAPTIGPFGFYRIDLFEARRLPGPQRR
jgi:Zn-dependent protease with chaperone function